MTHKWQYRCYNISSISTIVHIAKRIPFSYSKINLFNNTIHWFETKNMFLTTYKTMQLIISWIIIDSCNISGSPKVADLLYVPAAFFGLENWILWLFVVTLIIIILNIYCQRWLFKFVL